MNNLMTNRSKMLIRRATTQDSLLKKQQDPHWQTTIPNNQQSQHEPVADHQRREKCLKKSTSCNFVLQKNLDNRSLCAAVSKTLLDEKEKKANENDLQADTCSTQDKGTTKGVTHSSIGVTGRIVLTNSPENKQQVHDSELLSTQQSNTYHRSSSCGIMVTLEYLNHSKTKNEDRSDVANNDKPPTLRKLNHRETVNCILNREDPQKLSRSRRLPLFDSNSQYLLTNSLKDVDHLSAVDKGDDGLSIDDETEPDLNIGRFTRVFKETEEYAAAAAAVSYLRSVPETDHLKHKTSTPNINRPIIKQQLLPPASNLEKITIKHEALYRKQNRKIDAVTKDFDNINPNDSTDKSHYQLCALQNETIKSRISHYILNRNGGQRRVKMRRTGSVDPPKLVHIDVPINPEKKSKLSFKSLKSKQLTSQKETAVLEFKSSDDAQLQSRDILEFQGPQKYEKTFNFAGVYKTILPPIQLLAQKVNDSSSKAMPNMPLLKNLVTSCLDINSNSFPGSSPDEKNRRQMQSGGLLLSELEVNPNPEGPLVLKASEGAKIEETGISSSETIEMRCSSTSYTHTSLSSLTSWSGMPPPQTAGNDRRGSEKTVSPLVQFDGAAITKRRQMDNDWATIADITGLHDAPDSNGKMRGQKTEEECLAESVMTRKGQSKYLSGQLMRIELSPELTSFLISPCANRRGAICEVIDDDQGRPLTTIGSVVAMQDMLA